MKFRQLIGVFSFWTALIALSASGQVSSKKMRLWYDKPADAKAVDVPNGWQNDAEWLKALPLGNGKIGGMVFGGVERERIQLNEKSLWSGSPDDNDNPEALASLARIRDLLFAGKYKEANELTSQTQICKGKGSGFGNGSNVPFGCFQTLGDLYIDFNRSSLFSNYHRELDLNEAVASISYEQDGVHFEREVFVNYPDNVMVVRIRANRAKAISFTAFLNRPEKFATKSDNESLLMYGTLDNGKGGEGMKYATRLRVLNKGGQLRYEDTAVKVSDADEVLLILTAATDYQLSYPTYKSSTAPYDQTLQTLHRIKGFTYEKLKQRHLADYQRLFGRVQLELSADTKDDIPTDARLKNPDDLHLQELYFQFGRYLLIASSRAGALPANLQGIWANKIQTPWNGDYHTNINIQMNYWPVEQCNLSECFSPFSDLVASLVKPGEKTAKIQYNASGWVVHPITNVWGYTAPGEHPSWGLHVAAGGWLCQHLWEHYAFTLDKDYLAKVYPILQKSAAFYLDWLVKDPKSGLLVSGPASSPENAFLAPDGSQVQMSMGPAHDQQIIRELFTNVLQAAKILDKKEASLEKVKVALGDLATPKIASDGRLMEWAEEFKEVEPQHRHVSHLYMLHPSNQVDNNQTNQWADAMIKSLQVRGDVGTGWSLAWKINFWARLKDGNHAYQLLTRLLSPIENFSTNMTDAGGTYNNLFCGHPPFQIDGNFGATAGMTEMLLQSHQPYIEILPALPQAWKTGKVKGLKTRGGLTVGIDWDNNQLLSFSIEADQEYTSKVFYRGKYSNEIRFRPGKIYRFDKNLKEL